MIRGPHLLGPDGFAFAPHLSLGDIFFGFRGDSRQLVADAEKGAAEAGTKAGKTFGDHMKRGLKAAAIGGAVVGAALAGQQLKLNAAMAAFRAETGATAEEAEKAGKAINAMSGRNLQPIEEIGEALTKVHTDLGLTGEEAEKTTEQFLRFAQATGQDAAQAVLAFDDILDSWGLTAADAQVLMDKLIVSHEKYGGSIEDNQTTLAALAPAMRAANMEIDDGIALLNLFGAKGIDANTASAAFAKALTKVKSPEELQALIEDIAGTENAFDRAEKAGKLFGARAGAKLANALAGADLDDYKVSLEEAAGATDRARDASITFADQLALGLKGAIATATEVLGPAGPLLLGISSLASLAGPALAKVWNKIGGSAAIRVAVTAAGAASGLIYSAAAAGGGILMNAIAGAWTALGLSGSKTMIAAAASGARIGLAFAASAAAAPIALALTWDTENAPFQATKRPDGSVWLGDKMLMGPVPVTLVPESFGSALASSALARFSTSVKEVTSDLAANSEQLWGWANDVGTAGPTAAQYFADAFRRIQHAVGTGAKNVERGTEAIVNDLANLPASIRDTIEAGKGQVRQAMADLRFAMEHPFAGDRYANFLRRKQEDANRMLIRALRQGKLDAAAEAAAIVVAIQTELGELTAGAYAFDFIVGGLADQQERGGHRKRGRRHHYTGAVTANEMLMVGESGHEQGFLPTSSGYMWDVPDTREMQAGGGSRGGDTWHISVQSPTAQETPGAIVRRLRRARRMGVLEPSRS